MSLLTLAAAPVLICLFYIYVKDKYEKEPLMLLVTGVTYGAVITVPIVHFENFVLRFMPIGGMTMESFYISFFVAALVEEGFKFLILYFLVWHNNNFNEPVDGIVYGVFISLGFAGVENILYAFNSHFGGISTAIGRGIVSVPLHGVFGVAMGFYFALARFEPHKKAMYLMLAFLSPWFVHGAYDFMLLLNLPHLMALVIAFAAVQWYLSYRKIKRHLEASPFRPEKLY